MNNSLVKILLAISIIQFSSCSNNKKPPAEENIQETSLKSVFNKDFYIGAAINNGQIRGDDELAISLLKKEFNSITPENDLKWENIHPSPDSFFWDIADQYVLLGEKNNMHIVGHTLLWHSQLAPWMHDINDSLALVDHITNHIKSIVARYKGRIHSWDVVNEALNEDGTLRKSIFLERLGKEYLPLAFKLAAMADPDAELIYNDYNLWKPEKRAGVVSLVKTLKAAGVKIDGVGMQGHWSLTGPSVKDIENSIIAFSELGVKVSITELDITALPNPWDLEGAAVEQNYDRYIGDKMMDPYGTKNAPDSLQKKIAERYHEIFQLFLKHRNKIGRITFWGVNDQQSWLNNWPIKGRTNYPLLFNRLFQPKPAYEIVIGLKAISDQ